MDQETIRILMTKVQKVLKKIEGTSVEIYWIRDYAWLLGQESYHRKSPFMVAVG